MTKVLPSHLLSLKLTHSAAPNLSKILHDTNKKPVKVVPWKLNRAFMFAGETDVTWHSYVTRGNETRITLNTFYESTE